METQEVNRQMGRVLISSTRLKKLTKMGAPAIVLRNEIRLLQIALVDLFPDRELAQSVEVLGADQFNTYLNYIVGTEFGFPIEAEAGAEIAN